MPSAGRHMVIDASAAAFLVLPGVSGSLEKRLQEVRNSGGRLLAPSILASEVAAAITKVLRMRKITRSEAEESFENWQQLLAADVFELLHANSLLSEAFDLSVRTHHALHDCLYLAVAQREQATLLTADNVFARKARAEHIDTEAIGV
jgi:predicted nucleic acid-binding protein